jgi:hypothetical protein
VRARNAVLAAVAALALVGLAALIFEPTLEEALLLAPVIVVTAGATAAVLLLWARIVIDALRRQRRPGLIVAGGLAALGVLVVISFFVEVPSRY